MVPPTKSVRALEALNEVLVLARQMAYESRSHREIGEVLDVAEYLPCLLLETEDRTELFEQPLQSLAHKYPEFERALERFKRA